MHSLPLLSPTQQRDTNRLFSLRHGFICNPIGSGKTRVGLAVAQSLLNNKRVSCVLIVSKKQLKVPVWEAELLDQFPDMSFVTIDGGKKDRATTLSSLTSNPFPRVIIVHYEQLLMEDVYEFLMFLSHRERLCVLVEEAHNFKDRKTKQYKALRKIISRSVHTYLITGTPIMNNPADVFNLFSLLDPHILGSWKSFLKYCVVRTIPIFIRGRRVYLEEPIRFKEGATASVYLSNIFSKYIVRKMEFDFDLPAFSAHTRLILPKPSFTVAYTSANKQNILLPFGPAELASSPLVKLIRLRQLVSGEFLNEIGPKEIELRELLTELVSAGRKVVVYTPFRRTINRLVTNFSGQFNVRALVGGLTTKEQDSIITHFREQGEVLFMNDVGSEGLRLEFASAVVIYDLHYNPAKLDQIVGRVYRRGQSRSVLAYYLIIEGTVDEHLLDLIQNKRDLMERFDTLTTGEQAQVIRSLGVSIS